MSLELFFGIGFLLALLSLGASYVNHQPPQKHFPRWVLNFCEVWSPWSYESVAEKQMYRPEKWPTLLTLVGALLSIPYWWLRIPAALAVWFLLVRSPAKFWTDLDRMLGD